MKKAVPGSRLVSTPTILVVDDTEYVRKLVREFLKLDGYAVLEARDGSEAVQVAERYHGTIHLLVTDVVMPGMNGFELARCITSLRPATKVLYISGYAENAALHASTPGPGAAFLRKPFGREALARKVREMLESARRQHRSSRGARTGNPTRSRPSRGD